MANNIGATFQAPLRKVKKEGVVLAARFVDSTGTGAINTAVGVSYSDDTNFTLTSVGAGVYNLVCPTVPPDAVVHVMCHISTTVLSARLTTWTPTSGTGQITTYNAAGAPTINSTAGMEIHISIITPIRSGN